MAEEQKPIYRVGVLLFRDCDILDYAGPIEILSHAHWSLNPDHPSPIFTIDTIANDNSAPVSTGHGTLKIASTIDVQTALKEMGAYHALIVPGGPPKAVQPVIENPSEMQLIREFAGLEQHPDGFERVLMSVCTGAIILGAAGVLGGQKCTTHHRALEWLEKVTEGAGKKAEVVGGKRFVDAGTVKKGLRLITAGGVSSGQDATLHLVEVVRNRETAEFIARVMEYERRQ